MTACVSFMKHVRLIADSSIGHTSREVGFTLIFRSRIIDELELWNIRDVSNLRYHLNIVFLYFCKHHISNTNGFIKCFIKCIPQHPPLVLFIISGGPCKPRPTSKKQRLVHDLFVRKPMALCHQKSWPVAFQQAFGKKKLFLFVFPWCSLYRKNGGFFPCFVHCFALGPVSDPKKLDLCRGTSVGPGMGDGACRDFGI